MAGMGSTLDTTGALFLLLWAVGMWLGVGALHIANRRRRAWVYGATSSVIILGVLGQIGHLQEHVAQAGYWVLHPESAVAWMTPWGSGLAAGFQVVDPSRATLGMEILHFVGNCIFLAGLVALMVITSRARATKARKWAKMGVWMQGIHGLEHLSLMLSVWVGGKAIGLSTWFGLLEAGPGAVTYRVWWHFIANVIGSVIFAISLYHLWRERRVVRASFVDEPTTADLPAHTEELQAA
jgi:uncharacterized protein DUF6008